MNDLYTLLQVRDELEKTYEFAKSNSKHQWSGLLAARNMIHRMIQEELDARNDQEEAA